jgi:Secretion system C-terminal sorting domain/Pregnancy-associated plasma protein-A/CARDB
LKQNISLLFLSLLILIAPLAYCQDQPLRVPVTSSQKGVSQHPHRCSTIEALEDAIRKDPALPEKWKVEGERQYNLYLQRQQQQGNQRGEKIQTEPIIIPIVFHIVDVAATQASITDRDIYEQVEILNRDYSGKKLDQYTNVIPPEIVARVGRISIKFELARRDTNGVLTSGIERRVGSSPNHIDIKANATGGLNAWDETKYLNVWCGTFSGAESGLLGIATFPFITGEGPQGVVISTVTLPYTSNTLRNYYPLYSEGSTLSHEIGHYFYLWHTFGDQSSCNNNDFRIQSGWPLPLGAGPEGDDSPMQKGSSSDNFIYGNPSMNYKDGCAAETFGMMYGCFMNYFDDHALFMFSDGMRKRVEGCINLYRPGLLTTDGATPPSAVTDAFLVNVSSRGLPERRSFLVNNTPFQAIVRNTGTGILLSVTLNVIMDAGGPVTTVFPLALAPGSDTTLNLSAISAAAGNHTITVYTSAPNSITDNFLNNDTLQSFINIHDGAATLPFSEDFSSGVFPPAGWQLWNPNGDPANTWTRNTTSGFTAAGSAFFNNYDIDEAGTLDDLVMPALNLGTATSALLTFKVANAVYDNIDVSSWDGLEVFVSGDGGKTYNLAYKKSGNQLTTVAATTNRFAATPAQPSSWRTESIDLSPYIIAGQKMIIKFRNTNAFGNNTFIDDITVAPPPVIYNRDLTVISIDKPGFVECNGNLTAQATVKNKGTETITDFNLSYKIDNGTAQTTSINNITLLPDATMQVNLTPVFTSPTGMHVITIYSSNPATVGGTGDQSTTNDTLSKNFGVPGLISAPLTEGFESSGFPPTGWVTANPDANITWTRANTGRNSSASAYMKNFTYGNIGRVDDLYSPVVNYNAADSVTLSFDVSAATKNLAGTNPLDTLEVLITRDCGNSFTSVYKKWGAQLQTLTNPQALEFTPNSDNQWRKEIIDLTVGFIPNGPLQVVFRNINGFGNNIYIDNVNLTSRTLPPKLKEQGYLVLPNPFTDQFSVWHVQQPTNLRYIVIYNSAGQLIWKQEYNGNAQKLITIDMRKQAPGMYIVSLGYTDKNKNVRVKVIKL